jgi:hypothetical protein
VSKSAGRANSAGCANHFGDRSILAAHAHDVRHAPAHDIHIGRNHRGENARDSVVAQAPTDGRDLLRFQSIRVKIDVCVSVHLQVDIALGSMHGNVRE